ncbi:MAG: hypothetical protein GTO55_08960 [Armatimonadetes bacterium]|nr:hypothetical protein [Armatimonadota bacterium]NIM24377.1 hypothetical protein [Armatimonadota bacterium]NIM68246.1 hypothetical protein [Armatimonadota bacterium]NIM75147.1 hypothetical protein [Armatimonadota bacterium]NIN06451.1 hypothetical protein [Armatimonadota bacterium]
MSRIIKAAEADQKEAVLWQPEPLPSLEEPLGEEDPARHQAEAAAQISVVESEAKRIREAAHEQGLAEGREQAQKELEAKQAELAKLEEEIEAERTNFFDRMEPEVTRLAVTVAEKVLARELESRPETVVDLVKNAMKRMRERESLRVKVNPEDLPLVRAARDDLMSEVNGVKKLDLADDRRVGRGGCVIESSNGILDARVKTQLDEIERVISEATTHGKAGGTE